MQHMSTQVWVVYASMALIIAIVSLITIRGILALASWAALGRSLWLFPHLLSEVCCGMLLAAALCVQCMLQCRSAAGLLSTKVPRSCE